jgi:hypothetical protein
LDDGETGRASQWADAHPAPEFQGYDFENEFQFQLQG